MQERLALLRSRFGRNKLASPLVGDLPRSALVSPQSFREKGVSSGRLRLSTDGLEISKHCLAASTRLSKVLCPAVKLEQVSRVGRLIARRHSDGLNVSRHR